MKKQSKNISIFLLIAVAMILGGVYFVANSWIMDTSISTGSSNLLNPELVPSRVENIGLLNRQQNGIQTGLGLIIAGICLLIFDKINAYLPYLVYLVDERQKTEYLENVRQQEEFAAQNSKNREIDSHIKSQVNSINYAIESQDKEGALKLANNLLTFISENLPDPTHQYRYKEVITNAEAVITKLS